MEEIKYRCGKRAWRRFKEENKEGKNQSLNQLSMKEDLMPTKKKAAKKTAKKKAPAKKKAAKKKTAKKC
jgi:hypothetical protein